VGKFQGDRSRELGERVAKKRKKKEKRKKTSRAFYKSSRYYRKPNYAGTWEKAKYDGMET